MILPASLLALALGAEAGVPPVPALALDAVPPEVRERLSAAVRRASTPPPSAEAAGALGLLLHAHDQVAAAGAAYDRARALDPAAFDWPYLAGVLRLRAGRAAEAVEPLRAAVALRPGSVAARVRLGEALLAAGEAEAARALHRDLVSEQKGLPQAHFGLARAEAALGDTAAAVAAHRAAVRLFPAYGAAHYALGLLLRDAGRPEEARAHLQRYQQHWLEAPPLDDPALQRVQDLARGPQAALEEGLRLAAEGDLPGAIRETERALRIDPGSTRARANLIGLQARAGRWEEVEAQYRAAQAVAPGQVEVEYNYGLALQQQGRRREAAEAFHRVLAASPLHAPALNQLGLIAETEGRLDEAAGRYGQAAAQQAAFRAARFNLGRVLVRQGRPAEAVAQFEQILDPDDEDTPRYLHALGAAWARAGDAGKARRHLQEALRRALVRGQAEAAASIERDLARLPPARP